MVAENELAFSILRRYSEELLEKVKEMAEGIVVVDAPVFKTRDEIMKKQQVSLWRHTHTHTQMSSTSNNCELTPLFQGL